MSPTPLLQLRRGVSLVTRFVAIAVVMAVAGSVPGGTAYDQSKHGHPDTGVQRIPELGRGACAQCHDEHASRDGVPTAGPFNRALFMIDDETLCYSCHTLESSGNAYPGNVVWADSSHSMSPNAYWRGPVPRRRSR